MTHTDIHLDLRDPAQSVVWPRDCTDQIDLHSLAAAVRAANHGDGSSIIVDHLDLRYRAQDVGGEIHALRRLPSTVPLLRELQGLPESVLKVLMDPAHHQEGGMILIAGLTGSGKTTTASAMIRSRLEAYSGYCHTVEDPPEFRLAGRWGDGLCTQSAVSGDRPFPRLISQAMRAFPAGVPGILFVGEIRDAASAEEALKIAANGNLVVSTIHSKDILSAVQRLLMLAGGEDSPAACTQLSNALRYVQHQRLIQVGPIRRAQVEAMIVDQGASAAIMQGKTVSLRDTIWRTAKQLGLQ